jgi:hypothetical protein
MRLQRIACLLIFLLLLSGCGAAAPSAELAQQAASTPSPATATPRRPTATAKPTARPATPTARPPTVTPAPPTAIPTDPPPPATPVPPDDIPAGWVYHDVSQLAGFAFALPPSWNVVRLDRDGLDALAEAAPLIPQVERSPEQLAASGMKVIACECHVPANKPGVSTLFIMTDELPYAMSLDEMVATLVTGIQQSPMVVGPVKHARIPHPSGPAEAIQYRMRAAGTELTTTHYVMVHDRSLIFVGILASVDRAEQDTPTYYKIIQTLRLTTSAQPM